MDDNQDRDIRPGDLVRAILTDESPDRLFRCLAKSRKFQTDGQLNAHGAKVFKRQFSGIFGKKIRSYEDTLTFIMSKGLAESRESAYKFVKSIEGREVRYDFGRTFVLESVVRSQGERGYRLKINDYLGQIIDAFDRV